MARSALPLGIAPFTGMLAGASTGEFFDGEDRPFGFPRTIPAREGLRHLAVHFSSGGSSRASLALVAHRISPARYNFSA